MKSLEDLIKFCAEAQQVRAAAYLAANGANMLHMEANRSAAYTIDDCIHFDSTEQGTKYWADVDSALEKYDKKRYTERMSDKEIQKMPYKMLEVMTDEEVEEFWEEIKSGKFDEL